MNQLPNIAGTVANWSLNRTLADSSGNGLTLESLSFTDESPKTPSYVQFDDCTWGADCSSHTDGTGPGSKLKLEAAQAVSLRFTGPLTFQWTGVQTGTNGGASYFCCVNPDNINPHRNGATDRIGSLYNFESNGGNAAIADQNIGSNLPSPFYGDVSNRNAWSQVPDIIAPFGPPAAFAVTRDVAGNYRFYRSGVLMGTVPSAGPHTTQGNEVFFIGGSECTPPNVEYSGFMQFANVRVLNYERQPADILADANYMLSGCGAVAFPPVSGPAFGGGAGVHFDPDDRRDSPILRGKIGLSMQTGFKERLPDNSTTIAAFRNMTAAAQAANVFRQQPKIFPMPDDGRS